MNKKILLIPPIILALFLVILSCAGEPKKELTAAKDALEKAREAQADRYASDIFAQAENSLTEAENLIAQKNYGEAKKLLINAKGMADSAVSQASINKENVKVEAEDFISGSQKAIEQLKNTQKIAQDSKIAKEQTNLSIQIPNWEDQLKRAQEEFDNGIFDIASKRASEAYQQITAKDNELRELIMAKQKK
jgi:multidrug efflux pump subunit AcrA (membrane-fusion protein)